MPLQMNFYCRQIRALFPHLILFSFTFSLFSPLILIYFPPPPIPYPISLLLHLFFLHCFFFYSSLSFSFSFLFIFFFPHFLNHIIPPPTNWPPIATAIATATIVDQFFLKKIILLILIFV